MEKYFEAIKAIDKLVYDDVVLFKENPQEIKEKIKHLKLLKHHINDRIKQLESKVTNQPKSKE
jgi:hypothetical protein